MTPIFLRKGNGAWVEDVDKNSFIDLIQGLLPNILGYAHESIDRGMISQLKEGCSFSLPHPIEIKLAEKLCSIIPCAELVLANSEYGKS